MGEKEQARFVVGATYRQKRKVGGYQFGVLHRAVEEESGRKHGQMTVGGEADVAVSEADMGNWELVSEPGLPHIMQGPKYITDETLAKAVALAVGQELKPLRDRLTQLESELITLRGRVAEVAQVENRTKARARA